MKDTELFIKLDNSLIRYFGSRVTLISFRWFKYKEGRSWRL